MKSMAPLYLFIGGVFVGFGLGLVAPRPGSPPAPPQLEGMELVVDGVPPDPLWFVKKNAAGEVIDVWYYDRRKP